MLLLWAENGSEGARGDAADTEEEESEHRGDEYISHHSVSSSS